MAVDGTQKTSCSPVDTLLSVCALVSREFASGDDGRCCIGAPAFSFRVREPVTDIDRHQDLCEYSSRRLRM